MPYYQLEPWTLAEITGTLQGTRSFGPGESKRRNETDHLRPVHCSTPFLYPIYEREEIEMKRYYAGALAVMLALAGAASTRAQEVSQAEKDRALQYLESTKRGVLDATKGLSDAQWNFKPAPDRWSVAELIEHLAAAEDMLRGVTQEQIMKSPAVPVRSAEEIKKSDEIVLAMVPDRSHKVQAPEPLKPTNRFGSPEAAQKHFLESRAATEEYLKNTSGLRAHLGDSPLGKLDGYEFVLFTAAHSERHTKQMLEVKADPNFPKN
jgi:DinB superfamily